MASGDILTKKGSRIIFAGSGFSGVSAVCTIQATMHNNGRLSARADFGAIGSTPRARYWRYYGEFQCQATPTINYLIRPYLAEWNYDVTPANPDGNVGSADAAFGTEAKLSNLTPLVPAIVDQAAASIKFTCKGVVEILTRYASLVVWNASNATLTNVEAENFMWFEPLYDNVEP